MGNMKIVNMGGRIFIAGISPPSIQELGEDIWVGVPGIFHGITVWGITLARDFTWVEQQSTGAVGLRWIETLVCHMRRGSMEVRFLCCSLAVGTLDSQDSALEHQRTTDTRTTCLHLGNNVGKILYLERL